MENLDKYIENFEKIQSALDENRLTLNKFQSTHTQCNKLHLLYDSLVQIHTILASQHKQMIEMNNIFGKED